MRISDWSSDVCSSDLQVPPRAAPPPEPEPPTRPQTSKPGSLFGAFRAAPAKTLPRPAPPLPSFEITTVKYRIRAAVAAANDGAALYVPWRSPRIEFDAPAEHPRPLVESAALAAVALPAASYRPHLPKRVLDAKLLS